MSHGMRDAAFVQSHRLRNGQRSGGIESCEGGPSEVGEWLKTLIESSG